jgi:hypothetical protein
MAQCHPIHFQEINSVFAQLLTLDSIMPGSDTGNKRAIKLILTGPSNFFELAGDSLGVAMAGMEVAQGHYVSLELAQRITQARVARVGDNGNFLTLNAKARMT